MTKRKDAPVNPHVSPNIELVRTLIRLTGDDPDREGLRETPERFLKAWRDWNDGYGKDPHEVAKSFGDGAEDYDQLIVQDNIPFWSRCEHHLAPFFGVVHIGYLPRRRIIGLSKLARITDIYAHRLQVQERMTQQIAAALVDVLNPRAVAVVVYARHSCIESRGVCKRGSVTRTLAIRGLMRKDQSLKSEFLSQLPKAHFL